MLDNHPSLEKDGFNKATKSQMNLTFMPVMIKLLNDNRTFIWSCFSRKHLHQLQSDFTVWILTKLCKSFYISVSVLNWVKVYFWTTQLQTMWSLFVLYLEMFQFFSPWSQRTRVSAAGFLQCCSVAASDSAEPLVPRVSKAACMIQPFKWTFRRCYIVPQLVVQTFSSVCPLAALLLSGPSVSPDCSLDAPTTI